MTLVGNELIALDTGTVVHWVRQDQFRLHLHRGIAYLATPGAVRSVGDLIKLAAEG